MMRSRELSAGAQRSGDLLAAQLACTDVINAFAYYVDNGMAGQAVELFTDDGELGPPERSVKGRQNLEKALAVRESDADRRTRHLVTNIVFERLGTEDARAQSVQSFYLLGGADQLTARSITLLDDEFARGDDGRWRISRRLLTTLAGGR